MATLDEQLKEQIIRAFAAQSGVQKIILFGSRAREEAEERSDIDIAIVAPEVSEREWLDIYFLKEDLDTLLPIDLVRLEEAPPALKNRILKEGVVLFERR